MRTVKVDVNPRVREIENELLAISQDLGSLHQSNSWFTLLVACELAASLPADAHVADMTAGLLVRELRRVHAKAVEYVREAREFNQEVPNGE
jgi:hypothetical protein